METVYVLLEKDMKTESVDVVGAYTSYEKAEEVMYDLMLMYVEVRGYKIVDRTVV